MEARRLAVATSGGRDSMALLHATSRAAAEQALEVHALHVHHGLMPQADAWLEHVRAACERWRTRGYPLRFEALYAQGRPEAGDSVEAWARQARYQSLGAAAQRLGIGLVLLAHHRRDQAETVLVQALRGAGPAGLAAMPESVVRDGITWARPWLKQPGSVVDAYVKRWRIAHIDDQSNHDPRFARARWRALWPAVESAFPHADASLALTAQRAQEAAACLRALSEIDAAACVGEQGLDVARWLDLTPPRRANLLRHWLGPQLEGGLPETLLQRLLHELPAARNGNRWPAPGSGMELRKGRLAPL